MQLSFAWIGLQLETSYISLEIFSTGTLWMSLFRASFLPFLCLCQSCEAVVPLPNIFMSSCFLHCYATCAHNVHNKFHGRVFVKSIWYTVTHIFFATFELFLQIEFRCFDLFWFGFIDFAFEVITVPTTYVNETRYSFRLNVTVAELQDMKNQRSGKLMSSFTPAPSPFPCCENGHPMRDKRCCLELESNPKSRRSDSWISKCNVRTMLRCSNRGHSLS